MHSPLTLILAGTLIAVWAPEEGHSPPSAACPPNVGETIRCERLGPSASEPSWVESMQDVMRRDGSGAWTSGLRFRPVDQAEAEAVSSDQEPSSRTVDRDPGSSVAPVRASPSGRASPVPGRAMSAETLSPRMLLEQSDPTTLSPSSTRTFRSGTRRPEHDLST
jgi:hypothetical protein